MRISAIICEYNPFHNGHAYLNRTIKETGDVVVGIMSGPFTQRGDVALLSKYKRAKAALLNGADLIVELPAVYACSNAQRFARAGVEIAAALGCVDRLCFGSEHGSIDEILQAADAVCDSRVTADTMALQEKGVYYPKALEQSVEAHFGKELAQIIASPNNILGVEYCKALQGTGITPETFQRKGTGHDSSITAGDIASASHIRKLFLKGDNTAFRYIPENTQYMFQNPARLQKLEPAFLYKLRTMTAEEFKQLPDVGQGLENRIYSVVRNSNTLAEIVDNIKTKRYTHARIRRIMVHALLDITAALQENPVPYIRVLGFNEAGAEVLKCAKQANKLPVITKVGAGYKQLTGTAKEVFDIDLKASDIFGLARVKTQKCGSDFYSEIIKL